MKLHKATANCVRLLCGHVTGNAFSRARSPPPSYLSIISTQLDLAICSCWCVLTSREEGAAEGRGGKFLLCKCNLEKYAKPEIRAHFRVHFRQAAAAARQREGGEGGGLSSVASEK